MVRLTVDLINDSMQFVNAVRERELCLRACKIPVLENLGITADQFDTIDLTDNDIRKLENAPLLKRLKTLLFHNNRIQYIMPNIGDSLPSLKTLALTNNNLCELGDIDPLSKCTNLEYLTLVGNPVTHKPKYRLYIIYRVPSVRVLDFKRVRFTERLEAKALFKGKKGEKLRAELVKTSIISSDADTVSKAEDMSVEDVQKIQEAIESASSIVEVEHLHNILQSGRVPDNMWNKSSVFSDHNNKSSYEDGDQLVPETEYYDNNGQVDECNMELEDVEGHYEKMDYNLAENICDSVSNPEDDCVEDE